MLLLEEDVHASPTEVAAEINTSGVACLPAAVNDDWLTAVRESITAYLPANGENERFIENPDGVVGALMERFVADAGLKQLLRSLAVAEHPQLRHDDRIVSALRVLTGPAPDKPLWFHYDATVVTVVVPIVIPLGPPGFSGELLIGPNRRPYRRFAATNIVEKFIAQNDMYRRWYTRHLGEDGRVIPLEPGNAYLFWGYRTYHATLPCPPGALRVTLVLHYGVVHDGNRALAAAKLVGRKVRNWRGPSRTARVQRD